jgi:hypothetical protein
MLQRSTDRPAKPPSPGRQRQTRSRKRRREGRLMMLAEFDEAGMIEALIRAERLSESDAADRSRLGQAINTLLGDFIAEWHPNRVSLTKPLTIGKSCVK